MFKDSRAVCAVPSLVSQIQKSESTESSLTLHWTVPAQPHYNILQYQIRYCEKVRAARQRLPTVRLKCHIAIRCHDSRVAHNRRDASGQDFPTQSQKQTRENENWSVVWRRFTFRRMSSKESVFDITTVEAVYSTPYCLFGSSRVYWLVSCVYLTKTCLKNQTRTAEASASQCEQRKFQNICAHPC